MAECYDQEQEDRYRLVHRRLAYRPAPPHRPDDDEDEPPVVAASAASSSTGTAHLFGGSFQFIVQEQAKSMVAIQELQQEVGSLLLFRQAVLAALPHLHQPQQQQPSNALLAAQGNATKIIAAANTSAAAAAPTANIGGQSWTRRKQQHLQQQQQQQLTGGGGYRSLQDGSSDQPTAAITSSSSNNPVVDSGFSTEASNSNTSPRSSRFDTASSSEMTMPHQQQQQQQPMEKELLQHLERVQQRLARLKKDEDRLLTLLNLKRVVNATQSGGTAAVNEDGDELWILLEEIQLRSQAMRNSADAKDAVNKPEEAVHSHQQQSLSHKKRVSFQQQQQLLETEGSHRVVVADSVDVLPSPAGKLSCSTLSSSSPSRYQPPTRDQVAAILRLTNPVELQRHLLRALLDNQTLREQVESGRCDVESRDVQWRTKNQLAVEQMTALRDENEDLRFQLEEQKIELEGTKARLRMLNRVPSPSPHHHHHGAPAVTSVRVRATSTQTDRPTTLLLHHSPAPLPAKSVHQCCSQGTQTTVAELLAEDNNNKVVVVASGGGGGGGRALPRVVDASPKPQKLVSKLVDLAHGNGGKVNGSGSSWGDPDEERPSVEGGRRSYSSRIPTPIKPTVIPTNAASTPAVVSVNNYNNNNSSSKMVSALAASTTPSKRELPDIPATNKMMMTKSPLGVVTPVSTKIYQQRGTKSDPANAVVTTKVRLPVGSSHKLRTRLALTDSLSSSEDQQQQQQQHSDHHKVEDYYDSINANNKNRGSPMYQVQQHHSPVDSLERSLPSVGIPYNYQRRVAVTQQRDNRSYNSQSSAGSSTTPSNSLSFHHP
ncbi:uncharacterized protein LOC130702900 [Daphnia carinata]|uniref:uncharacterized protein LOC130702900 n=1 Tax=Daphnia carinata TaxID=120202 RepID=UPI00257F612B|nr:uncharacterized protein LOC130702900 [Daphnia carinata]XP_057380499.1 uncharacterized protein LOC130702900 [Daphnia carinata]